MKSLKPNKPKHKLLSYWWILTSCSLWNLMGYIWGPFGVHLRYIWDHLGAEVAHSSFFLAWFGSGKQASFLASISIKPPFASGFLIYTARQWNDGLWIYHAFPGSAGVEADSQTGWMTFENTRLAKCDSIQYLIHTDCKKWHSVRHHWTLCLIIRLVCQTLAAPLVTQRTQPIIQYMS